MVLTIRGIDNTWFFPNSVSLEDSNGGKKTARLNYNEVLPTKHKTHKPLSKDIEDEVRDLSDMADIHFTPDFDPEDK